VRGLWERLYFWVFGLWPDSKVERRLRESDARRLRDEG
jgi:hypothetical protein